MNNKDDYIKLVKTRAQGKHVAIYGAGRKAIGLMHFLQRESIIVEAFIVSSIEENRNEEEGIPVYSVDSNMFLPDETLILIGVRTRWVTDVIKSLEANGYDDYLEPPEGIEYLLGGDMDRSRLPVLQVTLQIGCKINCRYCPQDVFVNKYFEQKNRKGIISLEDFKKYVDHTERNVVIDFAGFTEPFLHPDCVEMIEYAYGTGHAIELFTTLVGMNQNTLDRILHIQFREVVLHIPDVDNNSIIPITDEYLELLDKIINSQKPDGRPFVDWGSCHGHINKVVQGIIDGKMRVITQLHDRAGSISKDKEGIERSPHKYGSLLCSGAPRYNHNVLLPDGSVLLCDSDWGMKHVIGSLKHNTYKEILAGDIMRNIQNLLKAEDSDVICRNCCYAENT